jgi:hypothetical protein
MASVVVYCERTPHGLHPSSRMALCVARDLGSRRGASVIALCDGDGGDFDLVIEAECGAVGADQLIFAGPDGLRRTVDRLRAKHVLVGWTPAGETALANAKVESVERLWVNAPLGPLEIPEVVGIVAGGLPWHQLADGIEGDYEGDSSTVSMPEWVTALGNTRAEGGAIKFVAPDGLSGPIPTALEVMGAERVDPGYADRHDDGTLLWLGADGQGVPESLAERPPVARVIALPGPNPNFDDSWKFADWVLTGPWTSVIQQLRSPAWKATLS